MNNNMNNNLTGYRTLALIIIFMISSCSAQTTNHNILTKSTKSYYGTLEPFASEAVYFLMTDRFVDGDSSNNFVNQGGQYPTFQNPLVSPDGSKAFVGYMGGDFKGIIDNAKYIQSMGFTSIWLTPIVDQPDEAFSGGEPIEFGGAFRDGGKTGYHGYWGVNFFKLDEHLPSNNLSFKDLNRRLQDEFQIKTVLDIVLNHGSPAFSMPTPRPQFGKIYDKNNYLIADHENLTPEQLDHENPLHYFYNKKTEIVQLSDVNENNPEVLKYFTEAYLYWIDQGADAFRIDTIKHMPHDFWKKFSDNIRIRHPSFFIFAESYSFDANFIAEHTLEKNGAVSVLDFPGREAILNTFEDPDSDFSNLNDYLYLENSPYSNAYELMTFYDNHDMSRMDASESGFIDAHNWLFTTRGIPVIYYGSEVAFMAGKKEHEGNRNYFGVVEISKAKNSPIHSNLTRIANVRKSSIALQKGLQINLDLSGNKASFLRVYEHEGVNQTVLVLLNKGSDTVSFSIKNSLSMGLWKDIISGETIMLSNQDPLNVELLPHQVKLFFYNAANNNEYLINLLNKRMSGIN